ncbi:MAG: ribosome maturation factor RimP [Acidobacteriota bacterium]
MPTFFVLGALFARKRVEEMTSAREASLVDLRAAVARIASSYGLEVFDLQFRRESPGWVLRVMLDRVPVKTPESAAADGINVEDCQHVSRDLSALLDVEEETYGSTLGSKYTLEVSSPGLDRPLRLDRGEEDFRRFEGRMAKVVTREPVNGQSAFAGRLAGVEDGVVLMTEGKRTHRVPLALMSRARLDVEF